MRKTKLAIIGLILLLISPFAFASATAEDDIMRAFDTVYSGVFSTVAAYVSVPMINLQGLTIESRSADNLVIIASYNRSDLANYESKFAPPNDSWYSRLWSSFSPLNTLAISILQVRDYKQGEAILDGTIELILNNSNSIWVLFDQLVKRDLSNIDFTVSVSVVVSGTRLSEPLAFEGELIGYGNNNGQVTIYSDNLICNGVEIKLLPVVLTSM